MLFKVFSEKKRFDVPAPHFFILDYCGHGLISSETCDTLFGTMLIDSFL